MSWINRILVPVDLSACSIAALRYGVFLSEHSGACLIVMHVEAAPRQASAGMDSGQEHTVSLERQRCKKVIQELLASVSATAARQATILMGRGDPVEMVVRTALDQQADLIVMGRHGDGCKDASHLGNVTRAVGERAACGVIPVHEPMRRGAAFALSVMGANDPVRTVSAKAAVRPLIRVDKAPRGETTGPLRHTWRRDPHPPTTRLPH